MFLMIKDSNFSDNYIVSKNKSAEISNKANHFYIKNAKSVLIDNCNFLSYSSTVMDALIYRVAVTEKPNMILNVS